jgi:TRAP-type mannitol/chloroaromatic compound transport system substrate-binding protein
MHEFGGLEIFRAAYAEYNVYLTGPRMQPPEPIMSAVPIRTIDDFKGVKIRTPPGLTTDFFAALGAVPVAIGGGEVYTALQTGVVDAVEFITLSGNYGTGLHEVSNYVIYPSPHTPVGNTGWEINMDAWNSLPDDLQAALEAVAALHTINYDVKQKAVEKESLDKMIAYGLEHVTLSDADWKATAKIGLEILEAYKSKSPLAAKVIDSKIAFWKKMGMID